MQEHHFGSKTKIKHFNKSGIQTYEKILEKGKIIQRNTIDIIVNNKDGSLDKVIGIPMRSFVKNYINFFHRYYAYSSQNILTDTAGVARSNNTNLDNNHMDVGEAGGIRLSTGDNGAVALGDYAYTPIAHGTGSGQLTHSSHTVTLPYKGDGTNYLLKVARTFTNGSGGTINIESCAFTLYNGSQLILLARDILDKNGSPVSFSLLNGQSVTFTYNFWFDLSDGWMYAFSTSLYNGYVGAAITGVGALTTPDTDGDSVFSNYFNTNLANQAMYIVGGVGATYGIMVGTGTTVVDASDNAVEGLIAHGTGSGQLQYSANTIDSAPLTSGSTQYWTISRTFTNKKV